MTDRDVIWKNLGPDPDRILLHGTAVALNGSALLLMGPSGSGKSSTALQMMAYGCDLLADDRVYVTAGPDGLTASTPAPVRGQIEVRGIGVLPAPCVEHAKLQFAVDLSHDSEQRFPAPKVRQVLNNPLSLYVMGYSGTLAAALYHLLKYGPFDDTC